MPTPFRLLLPTSRRPRPGLAGPFSVASSSAGGAVGSTLGGTVGSATSFLANIARAPLVIGATLLPVPTGGLQEVAGAPPPAAVAGAPTADAVPGASRAAIAVPMAPSLLLEEGVGRIARLVGRAPRPASAAAATRRRRPARAMAALAATGPRAVIPHAPISATREVQRAKELALVIARAVAPTGVRRARRASPTAGRTRGVARATGASIRRPGAASPSIPCALASPASAVPPFTPAPAPSTTHYRLEF